MRVDVPLPRPPAALRRGPFRRGAFRGALHDPRMATVLGRLAGLAFAVCFLTGLISHVLQHPPAWLPAAPTRPSWGYSLTQGLHVTTGLIAVPLLGAKLWAVYPRLFAWPPASSVLHALERLSITVLVAGGLFELVTGYLNTLQWYPWRFPFVQTHFWVAWITIGALLLHISVKASLIRQHWRRPRAEPAHEAAPDQPSRRGVLTVVGLSAGVLAATTAGQWLSPLRRLDLLAPRSPQDGPQHLPINRTAAAAGVLTLAVAPDWRLEVRGPRGLTLSRAQLARLPQHFSQLPISCVEGWSVTADWTGVRLLDLLRLAGAPPGSSVLVQSLEPAGSYRVMRMPPEYVRDPLTLLALTVNGEQLSVEHGYPARIIAPNRPGVLQTKWVQRIEVLPA